jgi:hypothetical protein
MRKKSGLKVKKSTSFMFHLARVVVSLLSLLVACIILLFVVLHFIACTIILIISSLIISSFHPSLPLSL